MSGIAGKKIVFKCLRDNLSETKQWIQCWMYSQKTVYAKHYLFKGVNLFFLDDNNVSSNFQQLSLTLVKNAKAGRRPNIPTFCVFLPNFGNDWATHSSGRCSSAEDSDQTRSEKNKYLEICWICSSFIYLQRRMCSLFSVFCCESVEWI